MVRLKEEILHDIEGAAESKIFCQLIKALALQPSWHVWYCMILAIDYKHFMNTVQTDICYILTPQYSQVKKSEPNVP